MSTVFARAQEGRETQTRATAGGREKVGRRSRRGGLVKKLNAGNDDESRMRAKRSIFDSTRNHSSLAEDPQIDAKAIKDFAD